MLQSAPPHLRHFIVHLENTMWCTSTPKDRRSLHGCRRCLGKELLLPWVYVVLLLFCIIFGQFQIQNYFLNDTAPRLVLFNYGLKTALAYFPLGSGFATYGSPVAASYYSPLYQLYGFNNKYGMSKTDTSFLNDNYWPTIIGQFGFLGLIIALIIFVNFFYFVMKSNLSGSANCWTKLVERDFH